MKYGTNSEAQVVTKQLSHSAQTHERYYAAISGPSHAAEAFHTMGKLRKEASQKPATKKRAQRHRFTENEESEIKEYFAPAILAQITPSQEECQEFLQGKDTELTKRQVQDKLKNIIKSAKKQRA